MPPCLSDVIAPYRSGQPPAQPIIYKPVCPCAHHAQLIAMNREEFDMKIRAADTKLRQEGLSVTERAHRAFDILAPNCAFTFRPSWERQRFPGRAYEGQDLYEKVQEWYQRHYGERSQWIIRLDTIPVIILDDIYFLRIPICFGNGPFEIEIIELVEGFTPLTGSLLTSDELCELRRVFKEGYSLMLKLQNLFNSLRAMPPSSRLAQDPFLIRADRDREIATRSLTIPYDANNSAFHSQQFAEKMLKSLLFSIEGLEEESIKQVYGHGLTKIWRHVKRRYQDHEHLEGSISTISSVKMEIRYSILEMTLDEAVKIFYEALRVSAYCAEQLQASHSIK
jgi:HEPN domain-containing protein